MSRRTLTPRHLGAALVVVSVVLASAFLVAGARWGEGVALSDPRRRVLVHPLHEHESLRIPFYATTDVVRVALHGVSRGATVAEPHAALSVVHRSGAGRERRERVIVPLPTTATRTRLEERLAFAWDAEAVNIDVTHEGPGEIELTLERLEGAEEAAVRAYRREPADLAEPAGARIDVVELGEIGDLPRIGVAAPKRSSWHRASVIAAAGGQVPVRALVLGPPGPPEPIPAREHVVPMTMRKATRAAPNAPLVIEAPAVPLVVRAAAFVPVENDASDRVAFEVRIDGGALKKPVIDRVDEVRPMSRAVAYQSGSPATEELVSYLLVPRGARATLTPDTLIDVELREIDIDLFDHSPDPEIERGWLGAPRPPSNALRASLEPVVLVVDKDLPVYAPRVLERFDARGEVPRPLLPFASSGRQAHVPVHVPHGAHARVVIDGGKPRRKEAALVRRLTPGVRTLEVADIADVIVGDDLARGDHAIEVYDGTERMLIQPVLKLPAHWVSGGALGPADDVL